MIDGNEPEEGAVEASQSAAVERQADGGLARVFREHHEKVFRAAYRITGNPADAEDVTQVVFLRLARREPGASALSDSPGAYLHRAAVNAALDVVRSRQAARTDDLAKVEPVEDPRSGPERREGDREIRAALRRAMATLTPRAAEMFALRYLEGYDNHEIAKMLGIPRMTVGVVLHRARARLRQELDAFVGGR
ncbi:MAG TPA: sigma-70 family RNA polymerase sigma factor [Candidatus Polarisedimenticolaceae bacterium]|nr:sigma-70 family RNA polymerase sigma factor [Candidatus Polarisedimenticolaceae bacterium]